MTLLHDSPTGRHSTELLDKPDSAALCFRTKQDAIDYASNLAEESNRRLAANDLFGVIDRYCEGRLGIAFGILARSSLEKYYLIFHAVKPRLMGAIERDNEISGQGEFDRHVIQINGCETPVLASIRKLVDSPKGIIPSLVRLVRLEVISDFRWQILAGSGNMVFEISGGIGKGELASFGVILPSKQDSDPVGHLVEGDSEIVCGIERDTIGIVSKSAVKFPFADACDAVTIVLDDNGPRASFEKGFDPGFQIGNVVLCTLQ